MVTFLRADDTVNKTIARDLYQTLTSTTARCPLLRTYTHPPPRGWSPSARKEHTTPRQRGKLEHRGLKNREKRRRESWRSTRTRNAGPTGHRINTSAVRIKSRWRFGRDCDMWSDSESGGPAHRAPMVPALGCAPFHAAFWLHQLNLLCTSLHRSIRSSCRKCKESAEKELGGRYLLPKHVYYKARTAEVITPV